MNAKDIFDQVLQLPEDEQRALQALLAQQPPDTHWGQQVIAALRSLSPDVQNDPAYADPVAWLKQQREAHDAARHSDRGS